MSKVENPWLATRTRTGAEYDATYIEREAAGIDVHGEATLVETLMLGEFRPKSPPASILDAGCGTGRMAIELKRRGFHAVGTDLDEVMLTQARAKAPEMVWHQGDLATIDIGEKFDAIVLAGNVMIYVVPGTELAVLKNMARHLNPGGILIASFQPMGREWTEMSVPAYESVAAEAGLTMRYRWSTWEQDEWQSGDDYLVSLHQLA